VSNRSSSIELAVKTAAKLDYDTLSTVSNSSAPEGSLLESIADSTSVQENLESQVDSAFNPELLQTANYDVSAQYGPTSSTGVQITDFYEDTKTTSEVQSLMMTPRELEDAVEDLNLAVALGDKNLVDYRTREKVAQQFLTDPVLGRVYHALHRLTDDINYTSL
jgi:hypothetical protein